MMINEWVFFGLLYSQGKEVPLALNKLLPRLYENQKINYNALGQIQASHYGLPLAVAHSIYNKNLIK